MNGIVVRIAENYANMAVRTAESYASIINSNSQTKIGPTSPVYTATMGDKNMAALLTRHGPNALYAHIMAAALDPVYGREFSLAQPEDVKPAVVIPLAEFSRQHERSELNYASDFVISQRMMSIEPVVDINRPKREVPRKQKYGKYITYKYDTTPYGKKKEDYSVAEVFRRLRHPTNRVYSSETGANETEEEPKLPYEGSVTAKVIHLSRSRKPEPEGNLETITEAEFQKAA